MRTLARASAKFSQCHGIDNRRRNDLVRRAGPQARAPRCGARRRLRTPHADPAGRDPARPPRARPDRARTNRYRQDRRVHLTHSAAPDRRTAAHAGARADADAGARGPSRRELPEIRPAHSDRDHSRLRRRADRSARASLAARCGCDRGDAGASARPSQNGRTSRSTISRCSSWTRRIACSTWGLRRRSIGS